MAKAKQKSNHTLVSTKVYAEMPEITGVTCEIVKAGSRLSKSGDAFPRVDMLLIDRTDDSGKRLWMKGQWYSHAKARGAVENFDMICAWATMYEEKTSARKGVSRGKNELLKDALIKRAAGDKLNSAEKTALSKHEAATLKLLS